MTGERPGRVPLATTDRGQRRWHFGSCVLDERTYELVVSGVKVPVSRKPLKVLIYLLLHAGEVCTKDELIADLWPRQIPTEDVLTQAIRKLRDALKDENQDIIKTVYGFGYKFAASVRLEVAPSPDPPHFSFRPGDHPPARPLWSLVERLGTGGYGEAWRGRHEKTREQRVFKFALNESALVALKREITLFRVINDTLGKAARVVRLLDWNLEQIPYFVEAEYICGGNLAEWALSLGGAAAIPLPDRLEIVAKIAEALAAVHSVGVLHKDLKPSNVLIEPVHANAAEVRLADFGSGSVVDVRHIENLGITRLGFTKTLSAVDLSSGTPMYMAPEVLAGQPFTVKADVYALGVILYQFLIGDFCKVMSTGWERGIEDEILREDIAAMTDGNPTMRLADAEELSRRLRTVTERRRRREEAKIAQEKADRARRLMERTQARRFGLILAFVTLVVGLVISTVLYLKAANAQRRSDLAAAQSKSVTEFLSNDVFAPTSSGTESVKNLTVIDLLTRAGNEIDSRFSAQPEVASQLHYVIGRSLDQFYETPLAVPHFQRAMEMGQELDGEGSESAMRSAAALVDLDYVLGQLPKTISRYEEVLRAGQQRLPADNLSLLTLSQQVAVGHYLLGDWNQSAGMFKALLRLEPSQEEARREFKGRTELNLGQVLIALARPVEAEGYLSAAITNLGTALGSNHPDVAEARDALGRALADNGRYSEGLTQLENAEKLALQWAPPATWTVVRPQFFEALLFLAMDQPRKAEPILSKIIEYQDSHAGLRPEMDHTGPVRQALGQALLREGQFDRAVDTFERAVVVATAADGANHPVTLSIRLSLAESLIASGRLAEAKQVRDASPEIEFTDLPEPHPFLAQRYRVDALLRLDERKLSDARELMTKEFAMYEALYGPKDWRTILARQDLSRVAQ